MRTNKPLSKIAATEYFEAKAKHSKILETLGHREILKVYLGREYALFRRSESGGGLIAAFTAVGFDLGEDGVMVLLEDQAHDGLVLEVGHIPVPVPYSDHHVFVSVPSTVWINREIIPDNGGYEERTTVAIMTKQTHKPDRYPSNAMRISSMEDFLELRRVSNV